MGEAKRRQLKEASLLTPRPPSELLRLQIPAGLHKRLMDVYHSVTKAQAENNLDRVTWESFIITVLNVGLQRVTQQLIAPAPPQLEIKEPGPKIVTPDEHARQLMNDRYIGQRSGR